MGTLGKGIHMAKQAKKLEPITNAVVAGRHAADALQMCATALRMVKAGVDHGNVRKTLSDAEYGAYVRENLNRTMPMVDDALAMIDWS